MIVIIWASERPSGPITKPILTNSIYFIYLDTILTFYINLIHKCLIESTSNQFIPRIIYYVLVLYLLIYSVKYFNILLNQITIVLLRY